MLFNRLKKSEVVYSLSDEYKEALSIFNEPYVYNETTHGCPAVSVSSTRLYAINAPADLEFIYNPKTNQMNANSTSTNTSDKFTNQINNFLSFQIEKNKDIITIQINMPYIFFTDTKDIEINLLPGTDIEMNNCKFIPGSFNIYNWSRTLNFSIQVIDNKSMVSFKWHIDKPMMFVFFNKPVNISYKIMNDNMLSMVQQIKNIATVRHNITKVFNTVLKRRPKNIL